MIGKHLLDTKELRVVLTPRQSSSAAFTPLESQKPNEVIHWYNKLAEIAITFNISICPFEHIELAYGVYGTCIWGVGDKYYRMSRSLHMLLSTKLLQMNLITDDSDLAHALELASDPEMPDGYELLHILLKTLVPAFDYHEIEITWQKFLDYDGDAIC